MLLFINVAIYHAVSIHTHGLPSRIILVVHQKYVSGPFKHSFGNLSLSTHRSLSLVALSDLRDRDGERERERKEID